MLTRLLADGGVSNCLWATLRSPKDSAADQDPEQIRGGVLGEGSSVAGPLEVGRQTEVPASVVEKPKDTRLPAQGSPSLLPFPPTLLLLQNEQLGVGREHLLHPFPEGLGPLHPPA